MPRAKDKDPYFPYVIPTARLGAIIQKWMDSTVEEGDAPISRAAFATGIRERRLYAILRASERPTVNFKTADQILVGLDLVDLWHVSPEDGGLSDWYDADEDNPLPPRPEPTPEQIKYMEQESSRHRKSYWQEYYKKQKEANASATA